MAIFLRNTKRLLWSLSTFRKNVRTNLRVSNKRFIAMSHRRFEKVLEDLQKNPFFDKYAEKIAKLQKTSPAEFLQRVESQEKKLQEKKVSVHQSNTCHAQSLWTFPFSKGKTQMPWAHIPKSHFSDNAAKSIYITAPIFYVNNGPHIGHLYSAVFADAMARFYFMLGHSVVLSTGTDEHGTKVERAASDKNTPTLKTTDNDHVEAVQHFWNCLNKNGYIYSGKYSGWYSVTDEAFVSESEVIEKTDDVGNIIRVTANSENRVEWTEEKTYKFRLSSFQDDLKHWLKSENTVKPAIYHKSLLTWIDQGLQDLSISRPIDRVPWAIRTPSNESDTIYVWLDALVNYLTSVGYPDSSFKQFWPPIHVVGKDILKFHGIYWPAFLMAVGLEPPKRLFCHGHWTIDDKKISKSTGNVISPFTVSDEFTTDGFRYFLLREAVPHSNANYSSRKTRFVLNAELANTFGNLLNRCLSRGVNPQRIISNKVNYKSFLTSDEAIENIKLLEELSDETKRFYEEGQYRNVVDSVMNMLRATNAMFSHHQPWTLRRSPSKIMEFEAVSFLTIESMRVASLILHPIIPRLTNKLLDVFQVPLEKRTWENTKPFHITDSFDGRMTRVIEPNLHFFQRLRTDL
ncbi:methionyl-tRNA synthetase, mitochondrial isoform X2 [Nomia melanderi]|uniref:methionyl-tRNA synthetase, mitochondrial isoform X2 n=1 Tax=Nomia melanderi TaxID=2448451 RepID=UPI0013047007|nr:methionine--tRNA ligase, mitochondrial-like isoform X2 [Nomia melanderi]